MDNALYQSLCDRIAAKISLDNARREMLASVAGLFVEALNEKIGMRSRNVMMGVGEGEEFRQGEYRVGQDGSVEFTARVLFRLMNRAVSFMVDVPFSIDANDSKQLVITSLDDQRFALVPITGNLSRDDFLPVVHLLEEPVQLKVEKFLVRPLQ